MSIQPISKSLRAAIEQLRPQLPALVGQDYASFSAQLEVVLMEGNEDQVNDLFMQYPEAYARLQDVLVQQGDEQREVRGGVILPGNVFLESGGRKDLTQISTCVKNEALFYCPESKQLVELPQEVLAHSEEEYRCPTHHQLLRKILSDNIEEHRGEGTGYMLLFYCNVGCHLLLLFRKDLRMNEEGDILCPEHHKEIQRIPSERE